MHRFKSKQYINFLFVYIPTLNSIESTVYRKPTHRDRYLDYNSNHPISAKLSYPHSHPQS